jgi:hypothetical protein
MIGSLPGIMRRQHPRLVLLLGFFAANVATSDELQTWALQDEGRSLVFGTVRDPSYRATCEPSAPSIRVSLLKGFSETLVDPEWAIAHGIVWSKLCDADGMNGSDCTTVAVSASRLSGRESVVVHFDVPRELFIRLLRRQERLYAGLEMNTEPLPFGSLPAALRETFVKACKPVGVERPLRPRP